jgi:hypothetical protein
MYELSHGSQSSKKRFGLKEFALVALLYAITINSPVYVPMIVTLGLFLYYGVPKNERRTDSEPKTELVPTYNLTTEEIICMLRNAQKNKSGL